jgi:hypothetical protein
LQNINKYNITEKDFFNLEETNNYKLFKNLLNEKILEKKEFQNTEYVKNAKEKVNKVQQKINNGDILFTDISQFFNKAKPDEEKLFEIIKTISLNNQNNAIDLKIKIDDFYIETIKVIDDLQLIHEDFIVFYLNKEKNNIEELKTIIDELKTGNLNCYKKKYVQKYNNFKNNYYEKAKERANKRKSIFFTTIFLNNQALYKNNDDKCVEETEKTFEELKKIFNMGIRSLDKDLLQICLNSIKGKSEKEIDEEIEILINIFNIQDYKKEQIRKSMIILSKKEDIYNVSLAISIFFKKIGVKGKLFEKCFPNKKIIYKDN